MGDTGPEKKDQELSTGGAIALGAGCLLVLAMFCATALGVAWIVWG